MRIIDKKIFYIFLVWVFLLNFCHSFEIKKDKICVCDSTEDCQSALNSCKKIILKNKIESIDIKNKENFVLDCNGNEIKRVNLIDSKNVVIQNCNFVNCFFGITSTKSSGKIKNNTFSFCYSGIYINKDENEYQNITLENNLFYKNSVGISLNEPISSLKNNILKNRELNFLIQYNCSNNSNKILLEKNYIAILKNGSFILDKNLNNNCFEIKEELKSDPSIKKEDLKKKEKILESKNKENKNKGGNDFLYIIGGITLIIIIVGVIIIIKKRDSSNDNSDTIEFGD